MAQPGTHAILSERLWVILSVVAVAQLVLRSAVARSGQAGSTR
jgi:hypothetical protein